jgi:hypothetical protein
VSHAPGTRKPHVTQRPSNLVLRYGDRNANVTKLQALLNSRLDPSPELKVDSYFGPVTLRAVRRFQSSRSITMDGVVGKSTWYHLISVGMPRRLPRGNIIGWSLAKKCEEVARRLPGKLPSELRAQFSGLISLQSLSIALVAFAVSSLFGVGELVGLGMLLILGEQVVFEFAHAIQITALATAEQELDEAADHLARAFAIGGVAALAAALAKFAGKSGGKSIPKEEVPPSEPLTRVGAKFGRAASAGEEDAAADTAAKPASQPSKTGVADEPPEPAPRPKKSVASEIENTEFKGVKLRVRPGANDKVAVIGRSMDNVVNPYAEGPGTKYNVETFSGDQISPAAQAEWKNLKSKYAPDPIPEDVVRNSQMFQEDQAWAQKVKDQGYTVVDADNPGGQDASPFYDAEKQILFDDPPAGAK